MIEQLVEIWWRRRESNARNCPARSRWIPQALVGKLIDDIASLVDLTSLNDRSLAEYVADRLGERLRAVDHDEHRTIGGKATVTQIGEQRRARCGVLRRALANFRIVRGDLMYYESITEPQLDGWMPASATTTARCASQRSPGGFGSSREAVGCLRVTISGQASWPARGLEYLTYLAKTSPAISADVPARSEAIFSCGPVSCCARGIAFGTGPAHAQNFDW